MSLLLSFWSVGCRKKTGRLPSIHIAKGDDGAEYAFSLNGDDGLYFTNAVLFAAGLDEKIDYDGCEHGIYYFNDKPSVRKSALYLYKGRLWLGPAGLAGGRRM